MTARRLGRGLAAVTLACGALVVPGGGLPAGAACALAEGPNNVAIVVRHENGGVITKCVGFAGASITGEAALQASGLQFAVAHYNNSQGDELCQVDNEPATPDGGWTTANCFGNKYWGVYAWYSDGRWLPTRHGISTEPFDPGEAMGLTYGVQPTPPPPSPVGVCPNVTGRPVGTQPTQSPPPNPPSKPPPAGPTSTAGAPRVRSGATSQSPPPSAAGGGATAGPSAPAEDGSPVAMALSPPARTHRHIAEVTGATGPPLGALAALGLGVLMIGLLAFRGARARKRQAET